MAWTGKGSGGQGRAAEKHRGRKPPLVCVGLRNSWAAGSSFRGLVVSQVPGTSFLLLVIVAALQIR